MKFQFQQLSFINKLYAHSSWHCRVLIVVFSSLSVLFMLLPFYERMCTFFLSTRRSSEILKHIQSFRKLSRTDDIIRHFCLWQTMVKTFCCRDSQLCWWKLSFNSWRVGKLLHCGFSSSSSILLSFPISVCSLSACLWANASAPFAGQPSQSPQTSKIHFH